MALITKKQAIDHLRPPDPSEIEDDLESKMEIATDLVVDYLKQPDHGWTDATAPAVIQGAILEVLSNIFYDRGDREKPSDGPITPRIKNALAMRRDPTVA